MVKSIFGAAPTDEFAIMREARKYIAPFNGRIPMGTDLRSISKDLGNDMAAAIFAECVRASNPHAQFIRDIDGLDINKPTSMDNRGTLIMVPAQAYQRYPFAGGNGGIVMEVARSLGMQTHLVKTSCRATIEVNARTLATAIESIPGTAPIWIASISKAALEVRRVLDTRPELIQNKRVMGWISICGMPNGVSLIERARERFNGPIFRLLAMLADLPMELVRQMCSDHKFWERPIAIPSNMTVINIVAVPLLWHMQRSGIIRRYKLLGDWGPNDGTVLIGDSSALPGLIYPMWGADHYMRVPGISFLIRKILRYALNLSAKQEPSQNLDLTVS